MSPVKKSHLVALLLVQVFFSTAFSQTRQSNFNALILHAEPEKTIYTMGEPLKIVLDLKNPTDSSIEAPEMNPSYGSVQVYISRNGEEYKRYLAPGWGAQDKSLHTSARIAPGESLQREITVQFHQMIDGRGDLMESSSATDQTGTYEIRIEVYDNEFRKKISARPVSLAVIFSSK